MSVVSSSSASTSFLVPSTLPPSQEKKGSNLSQALGSTDVPVYSQDAQFPIQKGVKDTFLHKSSSLFTLPSYRGRGVPAGRGIYHHLRSVVMFSTQEMRLDVQGRERSLQRLLHVLKNKPQYQDIYGVLREQNALSQEVRGATCAEGLAA